MRYEATKLAGAVVVELELREDERGFFARSFCAKEFAAHGLSGCVAQCNVSYNRHRGTLRGLHWQEGSAAEAKLVRCTRGGIYDVIVDLRQGSGTYLEHVAVELTAENHRALYVPEGFAHGFLTLKDETEIFYQMNEFYTPAQARGLRYNDPRLRIEWPLEPAVISDKDMSWPSLEA